MTLQLAVGRNRLKLDSYVMLISETNFTSKNFLKIQNYSIHDTNHLNEKKTHSGKTITQPNNKSSGTFNETHVFLSILSR